MKNLAISMLLALPVALASQGTISLLVVLLEPEGGQWGMFSVYGILAVQIALFAIATLHLAKFPSIRRKVESVLIWAGLVLAATIPLLLGIMLVEAFTDTSPNNDGAAAAFFMLIIFGGAYGGLGLILLIAGFFQRRSRRAAERQASR